MALASGTRVGIYEVTAKIGEGGMGEVYQARDTTLDRDVALKVLPEAFVADPDRLARFQREAKVLASLNHPNIGGIYGLESSGDIQGLVLELVEGPTLQDRIADGPMAVGQALAIIRQIADALSAAHDAGVVHRDVKPANVKVRPDGTVKVLDFGLAKATETPVSGVLSSPTMTAMSSQAGAIIGTAAYMSPEQARGEVVDKRADIWALGCVLYELVTGRRAFQGQTLSDTLASVLARSADFEGLSETVPAAVRKFLERSLEKDVSRRLRDASEGVLQLEEGLAKSAEDAVAAGTSTGRWGIISGGIVGLVTAAVILLVGTAIPMPWASVEVRSEMVTRVYVDLPSDQYLVSSSKPIALSPDGSLFVYAAIYEGRSHLYLRDLTQSTARQIPGTEGGDGPFFSPDGEWIGFFANRQLRKISVSGGDPITLCSVQSGASFGASWGQNERIIFALAGQPGLMEVSSGGGTPEAITTLDSESGQRAHVLPQVLPGGRAVLFTTQYETESRVSLLFLETGEMRELSESLDVRGARYVPSGHLVYVKNGGLWAVSFDLSALEIIGGENAISDGVYSHPDTGAGHFVTSETGTLIFVSGNAESVLVWVDRGGRATVARPEARAYWYPRLSPDGERLAVVSRSDSGSRDVWILDVERERFSQFTVEGSDNLLPVWSLDGQRITFGSSRLGSMNLFSKAVAGGNVEPLLVQETALFPFSLSPDGQLLAYFERNPSNARDIWLLDAEGEVSPLFAGPSDEKNPVFSPGGSWIAYVSNESGREEVYVASVTDPADRRLISTNGGSEPAWARDGAELFYRNDHQMYAVSMDTGSSLSAGNPELLFEGRFEIAPGGNLNYDVAPDGRFLMLRNSQGSEAARFNVVLNWFKILEQRVPAS